MTDKPKKFKVTKRVYNKIEDTYWEEFEMTQENWNDLMYSAKQDNSESVKHLSEKMTEKTEDWELLYALLSNGDFQNCDKGTRYREEYDDEQIFIEEVKE
tara:strand:- start:349 stop:648 length:300 start_codon:yes stop_codon:yes gene_type:complete